MSKYCPNCGSDKAIPLKDNRIMCPACNATFKVEEDGSARTVDTDPLGKINKRIDELENKLPGRQSDPPEVPLQEEEEISEENDGFLDFGRTKNVEEKTEQT